MTELKIGRRAPRCQPKGIQGPQFPWIREIFPGAASSGDKSLILRNSDLPGREFIGADQGGIRELREFGRASARGAIDDPHSTKQRRYDGGVEDAPMAEERIERRLAAILAADVAGYSRLIGRDEEGTLSALRALRRELIDPAIAAHRGPDRQDDRRRHAGRVRQRARRAARCRRGARRDGRAQRRCRARAAHRVPHRHPPGRHRRRGRRHLRRRGQCRGAARRHRRAGRDLRLGAGAGGRRRHGSISISRISANRR